MDVDGQPGITLRLLFEEDFFLSHTKHVLLFMVATMDRYFIIFNGSYNLGLAPS
jgi:hypothetical protein